MAPMRKIKQFFKQL